LAIGDAEVFGEGTGAIYADTAGAHAKVPPPGEAIPAAAADKVSFAGNQIARFEVVHIGSSLYDSANELVAHVHWHGNRLPGPLIPIVDMDVRTTNRGPIDFDQYIINSDVRNWHVL
jgi:hypothetical protein